MVIMVSSSHGQSEPVFCVSNRRLVVKQSEIEDIPSRRIGFSRATASLCTGGDGRRRVLCLTNVDSFWDNVADGLRLFLLGLAIGERSLFCSLRGSGLLGLGVSGDRSRVLFLRRLHAVQSLAGTASKTAEHRLALVWRGGLCPWLLGRSLGGLFSSNSGNISHWLLNLSDGLSGGSLLTGGNGRDLLCLDWFLHVRVWTDASVALDETTNAGQEVVLLLAGSRNLFFLLFRLWLDSRLLKSWDSSYRSRLCGGGSLWEHRWLRADSIDIVWLQLGIFQILLLGRATKTAPARRHTTKDATTLVRFRLLLRESFGRLVLGNYVRSSWYIGSGSTGNDWSSLSRSENRCLLRRLGFFFFDLGLLVLSLLFGSLLFSLFFVGLEAVQNATRSRATLLGLLLSLLELAIGRTETLSVGNLGALLWLGKTSSGSGANDVGLACGGISTKLRPRTNALLTELLNLGFVALTGEDLFFRRLAMLDSPLNREIPAVTLGFGCSLEGVVVAVKVE